MSREGRLFIESSRFPVALVSAASAKEKQGGGRPPFWEMVFWWTRKPLASARAVIAGCLLPEDIDVDEFVKALWLDEKVAHRHNPIIPEKWRQYFSGKRLLDPFAGFGSIPLEAMRLGLNATAVELPPSCYIFLKAVLEYPQRYGEQLVKDVECWGKWITKSLKEDQVIKKLYDSDVAIYIGSWEVKCPHCGKWTPLIGNFWLARVKNKDKYTQLAWMKVVKNDKGELSIEVEDLSEKLESMEDIKVEGNKIKVADTVYTVPSANISPRSEQAMCLNCNGTIRYVDIETGKHYVDSSKAPNKQLLEWYVKYALKKFNSGQENYARLRLLVRVKAIERSLKFEPCTEKDQEKLEIARKEILKMLEANDPDIPREGISPYSVRYLFPILYGMTEWYKLFNPRQLLTLVKLVKLIREAGKQIEQEKIKEGLSKEEAFKYAEEVTTYLVIALCKHADYNSMMSGWQLSYLIAAHSLAMRGIAMIWNWGEYNPFSDYTGAISSMIKRNVVNGLSYLVSVLHNISNLLGKEQSERGVKVLFDDATVLTKLGSEEKFDLIVTDPPYYDDVPYTELSDFYYVWLKRALSDVRDNKLQPRFHADAFFKRMGSQVIEIRTQWEEFALREVSLNPPRLGENVKYEEGVDYFQKLLDASFISMRNLLKEKGVLVTYYAHTDPEAWKALLRSGWESAALSIVNVFPIATEFALSVVKRGKLSLDTSIVVVWKGFASGSIRASQLYEEMGKSSEERARILMDIGIGGRDLFIGTLAGALSAATKVKEVIEMKKLDTGEIVDRYVYPATLYGLVKAITKKARVEEGVKSSEAMLYLVVKSLAMGAKQKVVTSDDVRIFSIGTGVDLSYVARNLKMFRMGGREEEGTGASLAKRKTLILIEPPSEERIKVKDFLDHRELDPENPKLRCSVDALHLLEYYAVSYGKEQFASKLDELRKKYPAEVDEAITLARIISGSLTEDIEAKLCSKILDKITQYRPSQLPLTEYLEGEK
jgi:putative DNA methylase